MAKAPASTAASSPPPVIVIVGQTASGKSALAMRAACKFGGEIICADSRTVYTGMDIGTAKPSSRDRRLVAHHALDLVKPDEHFSAAAFQKYAREKVVEIQARGKLPIIVGGTGLYIDAYVYDFSFAGEADPALRTELEALSLEALQARAGAIGLIETQIDFQNPRHLSRAIERVETPEYNALQNGLSEFTQNKMRPSRKLKSQNICMVGMKIEQEQLLERITLRVDTMFDAGFLKEVQNLINLYDKHAPGLLAPGYKEACDYLAGDITQDECRELFIRRHKYLAKRQQTWFKRNLDIIWVQSEEEAIEYIGSFTQV